MFKTHFEIDFFNHNKCNLLKRNIKFKRGLFNEKRMEKDSKIRDIIEFLEYKNFLIFKTGEI